MTTDDLFGAASAAEREGLPASAGGAPLAARMRPRSLEEVRGHLASAGLAKQKWPESLYVLPDFPRTASGKVQKFKLRQQLRDGELA